MSDYRRLIAFGKSSYVVSLPKKWVDKHKLEKGSNIGLHATDRELILYPDAESKNKEAQDLKISVDNKDIKRIRREIISGYINSYNPIILYGTQLSSKATEIREILHNLMALEVMEHTSDKIIARDFLNMQKLDMISLVRKADLIIRSMIHDAQIVGTRDSIKTIEHRDEDVNRLAFLLYRGIRYSLQNPMNQSTKLSAIELLELYWQVNNLEKIADCSKRMAIYISKLNDTERRLINNVFSRIEENFTSTMKALYAMDIDKIHSSSLSKDHIVTECDNMADKAESSKYFVLAINELKNMVISIHNVGRTAFNKVPQ